MNFISEVKGKGKCSCKQVHVMMDEAEIEHTGKAGYGKVK